MQIKLAPVHAPYFEGAKLLIAADCTAYAYANFHQEFMRGKVTLIGCPKLDAVDYSEKLTEILRNNDIQSVTILRMEVPCCGGLEMAAKKALQTSGKFIPWQVVTISTDGKYSGLSRIERISRWIHKMFCFQCEQTAGCTGCTGKAGVCGKTADVATASGRADRRADRTGQSHGRRYPGQRQSTWRLMIEGLFTTVTNVNFNENTIRELIGRVHAEKARLAPDCAGCAAPCGRTSDYDMNLLWSAR